MWDEGSRGDGCDGRVGCVAARVREWIGCVWRGMESVGGVGGAMVTLCYCFLLQCTAASDIDLDDILRNFEGIFCGRLVHSGV